MTKAKRKGAVAKRRPRSFFYTPEWQAKEREADEAIARGDLSPPADAEETIAELRRVRRKRAR